MFSLTPPSSGWHDQRDDLAPVASINAEIAVHGDDPVVREQLAHADEAEVGEVGMAIRMAPGEPGQ
jgi:hypothetical protein